MKNITINAKNRTIEMNKTFSATASKFGTREYDELQTARRDYPNYKVVTVAKKTAKPTYKGLTFDYMKKYIEKHDDENKSIMADFLILRGMDDAGEEFLADSASYSEIREWFFKQFPEIEAYQKKREAILNKAA